MKKGSIPLMQLGRLELQNRLGLAKLSSNSETGLDQELTLTFASSRTKNSESGKTYGKISCAPLS